MAIVARYIVKLHQIDKVEVRREKITYWNNFLFVHVITNRFNMLFQ